MTVNASLQFTQLCYHVIGGNKLSIIYSWQINVGCHLFPSDGYKLVDYFLQIWERKSR